VLVYGPETSIQGARQFSEAKAKEHAIAVASAYIHNRKKDDLPATAEFTWEPAGSDDWLVWC
jgi:hypothetical protein